MSDVFEDHPELDAPRQRLFDLIERTPWLTWQMLTKRPENLVWMLPGSWLEEPLANVWLGTSIENSRWTFRADDLRLVPAALRFLSCEPLLGSLFDSGGRRTPLDLEDIGWVIGGGESGPHARPFRPEWARELRDACTEAELPFFWKQNGGLRPKSGGKDLDGREWCEIPEHGPSQQLAFV